MAIDGVTDEPRLGCGRPIDQVWERVGLPPDAHEADCPDCQRARASLAELSRITDQMRESDEQDPDLDPGPALKNSIMDLARAEVRRGRMLPLRPVTDQDDEPDLTISEQAVAAVVRAAADTVPGLRARRCQVRLATPAAPDRLDGAILAQDQVTVRVQLSAAVSVTAQVPTVTAELRRRVSEQVAAETGLLVQSVDVSVEDLFDA